MREGRHQQILALLRRNERLRVADLSAHLGVSPSTVRRDLDYLQRLGHLRRTHGGALLVPGGTVEPPVFQRQVEQAEEKRRIGRAAAALVRDGDTVFLGSGTTTYYVAQSLAERENLTIITNALNIANVFATRRGITLIVVGGLVRQSELSMIGHIAEHTLGELRADKVIIGIRAISVENGLMNDYLPETLTDRAILNMASQVIIVADHTKLGRTSTAFLAPISRVHTLVTDSGAPPELVERFRQAGVRVVLA